MNNLIDDVKILVKCTNCNTRQEIIVTFHKESYSYRCRKCGKEISNDCEFIDSINDIYIKPKHNI